MNTLIASLRHFPVIAAVRSGKELDVALQSPVQVVSMMGGSIREMADIISRIHSHNKKVLLHPELVKGLGRDPAGIEFLAETARPDGIISTKRSLLRTASSLGLLSVLQVFMIDTQAFETGLESIESIKPDAVEIMPGLMPRIVACVKQAFGGPVLTAGLVKTQNDIESLLAVGVSGIAVSEQSLWSFRVRPEPSKNTAGQTPSRR